MCSPPLFYALTALLSIPCCPFLGIQLTIGLAPTEPHDFRRLVRNTDHKSGSILARAPSVAAGIGEFGAGRAVKPRSEDTRLIAALAR